MDRPGLRELLRDAEARAFDVLLVFRVDRLSRKVHELAQMVDQFTKWGVALKSITEPFDTANLAGKMMLQMVGVFAEFEHGTIVERTKVGMEKKARTGVWVGGAVPYGYRIKDDKSGIVIHEDEALVVRKIFKIYAEGQDGVQTLRDQLTAMGYRKRSGKPWDPRTLLHVLRNPVYVGGLRWKGELHEGTHEAIVSEDLFARANQILTARSEQIKGRHWHNGNARLLSGITRCGLCGGPVVGVSAKKKGQKFAYYACVSRLRKLGCNLDYIRAQDLEKEIVATIRELFQGEDMLERIRQETDRLLAAERPEVEAELAKIGRDLATATETRDRYFSSFESGTLSPAECGPRLEAINALLRALQDRQSALEEARTRLALPALDRKAVAALMDEFETVFDSGTNGQRKHLLQLLVKKVLVHSRNRAEAWFTFPEPAGPGPDLGL